MTTLVFGFQGQLGHALSERMPQAAGVDRASCDITNAQQLRTVFATSAASRVFNAAAYNVVDEAESRFDTAHAVNGMAPGRMASLAREYDAEFVHYSTDYVFGDGFADPIDETRTPKPLSAYGRSKLHGETLALQNNPRTYVIRTTGVYSHRRKNFVRTMVRHAIAGTKLTVVNDQFVCPTWAEPLADASLEVAETGLYGVYHVTSRGQCSWFEFAGRIFEILDIPADLHAIGQDEWAAEARRPSFSVLDSAMLRATGISELARWDDMLESFLDVHADAIVSEATSA